MRDRIVNHSHFKKTLIFVSFFINIVSLMLISFLWSPWVYFSIVGISFIAFTLLIAINKYIQNKMIFIFAYSVLPLWGITMYLLGKFNGRYLSDRKVYQNLEFRVEDEDTSKIMKALEKSHPNHIKLFSYFANYMDRPVYQNSVTKFLNNGNKFFEELFKELKNAKHYILLQEFMIKEGAIWNQLFEILKQKARDGVEVKLLYDPLDCKDSFTDKLTFRKLENYKIDCKPFKAGALGYENHRKLAIIDGVVGFCGAVNISDIYVTPTDFWEVSGIKITGDAVWKMATGFFNDWQFSKGELTGDFINYMPEKMPKLKSAEFVQPIQNSPITNKDENKQFILNMVNNANSSINIISSYINVDRDVVNALSMASQSGVKVTILTSSISDRTCNFAISRDYYKELMRAGVKILEYNPGFVRSKMILIDNEIAFVGTVALDTRWFNQKYENGVIVTGSETVREISKYFLGLQHDAIEVGFNDLKEYPFSQKFIGWINRLFRIIQ